MSYTLYTDKNENFECEVSIKNASLKGSIARLVVEAVDGPTLVFKGQIQGDKCIIPVKKVWGLLDENAKGKIHLEMIVEDIYFRPWESDFIVEEHTSIKVKVNEQKETSNKPLLEVKSIKKQLDLNVPLKEIAHICKRFDINKENFKRKRKKDFVQILKEYFKITPEYSKHSKTILNSVGSFL